MNALVKAPPLEGEILSGDDVRVVVYGRPFAQASSISFLPSGLKLDEIVRLALVGVPRMGSVDHYQVRVGLHVVAPELWPRVRAKPGVTVVINAVPQGPLPAIFAAIGAAVGGFQTFIASMGIFGKLLMAGLSIGFKLLINALFPPPKPPPLPKRPKEAYNFAGARNQAAPFETVPVVLGRHRVSPFYGGLPYTEVVGDEQYLRVLFVVAHGAVDISDVRIGETPVSEFQGVTMQIREGYSGDAAQTLYPTQVIETDGGLNITLEGPEYNNVTNYKRSTRYTAENINEIGIDFFLPSGLIRYDSEGKKATLGVTLKVRYRAYPGGGAWTNRPDIYLFMKTQDPQRVAQRWDVPVGPQYEVEIYRVEPEPGPSDTAQRIRTVVWGSLKGFRPGKPVNFHKPLAIIAMRIKASGQLNGTLDTVNCLVTSKMRAWNGSTWVADTPTQWPSDHFRHVLQGPANARPKTDAEIDLVALQQWNAYCKANGFKYNRPLSEARSVFDTLAEIAAAGRASVVFRDGKWSVAWDEKQRPIVQMFTPRNSRNFEARWTFRDLPHAWRIPFVNEDKRFVQDERIVYDDAYNAGGTGGKIAATKFEGLELPGITDRDLIYKHGRFHIAALRLRPATYTLDVDFEHLILTRGDRVYVSHDAIQVGVGRARIKSIVGMTVTLDEYIVVAAGRPYQMRFRRSNNTYLLRDVASVIGGLQNTFTLTAAITGFTPPTVDVLVGDLATIGEAGSVDSVYCVKEILPSDDYAAKLVLVDDAPEIWDADTGPIPPFDSNVTVPIDLFTQPPSGILVSQVVMQQGVNAWAAFTVRWTAPPYGAVRRYEMEFLDDGVWRGRITVAAPMTQALTDYMDADQYQFRVRAIFETGEFSRWATSAVVDTGFLNNPPPDPLDLRISTLGPNSTLSWRPVTSVNVTTDIRFVANGSTVSWNSAIPLLEDVTGNSAPVATLVGTYLVKHKTQQGLRSTNAMSVFSNVLDLPANVVSTSTQHPAYSGTKTNVVKVGNDLKLTPITGGVEPEGYYYFAAPVDLLGVYTCRVTSLIEAVGEQVNNVMSLWDTLEGLSSMDNSAAGDWGVELEIRTSQVSGSGGWSAWSRFAVGDFTARQFDFRLRMFGRLEDEEDTFAAVTPVVSKLVVTVDMPDRIESADDVLTTGGVSGKYVVTYPGGAFQTPPALAVTPQGMVAGDRMVILTADKTAAGFQVRFFNTGGTGIDRSFDWVAKGYGKVL